MPDEDAAGDIELEDQGEEEPPERGAAATPPSSQAPAARVVPDPESARVSLVRAASSRFLAQNPDFADLSFRWAEVILMKEVVMGYRHRRSWRARREMKDELTNLLFWLGGQSLEPGARDEIEEFLETMNHVDKRSHVPYLLHEVSRWARKSGVGFKPAPMPKPFAVDLDVLLPRERARVAEWRKQAELQKVVVKR